MSTYRFYRLPASAAIVVAKALPPGCTLAIWRPRGLAWRPGANESTPVAVAWWLFHLLRVFRNRDYSAVVISSDGVPVHRSFVFPGFFRFPFMQRRDVQIGDTWTDPAWRGRGLATAAIVAAANAAREAGGDSWYVVEESNAPSIRAVEKAGFRWHGTGARRPRLGLRLLGEFRIDNFLKA